MSKKISKFVSIICFFLIPVMSIAQSSEEKKANKSFDYYQYVDAIEIYEKIVNKGYKSINVLTKLADAYYFKGELKIANRWYGELFDFAKKQNAKLSSEYYYRYAQTLRSVEYYSEADKYLTEFTRLEKKDSRGRLFIEEKDRYLEQINSMVHRYDIRILPINSRYSDYGSTLLGNQLVFTSARGLEQINNVDKWTNEAFTRIYTSVINKEGSFGEPLLLDIIGKGKLNVASAIFTKDAKTMYFTSNNLNKKKKSHDKDFRVSLKLYKSVLLDDGKWSKAFELPFNSDFFNTAHPCLSPDEKWLYFVSDRLGSLGDSDIFRVSIGDDGTYSVPENLGKTVNTEGRESFPFISKDNYLYFSSDGRPGLGGLDVYKVKIYKDNRFGKVVNIGAPLNSSNDDFGFYINHDNKKGFISSNREGGMGSDDIYYFELLECNQTIEGDVFSTTTKESISQAEITLYDNQYKHLATIFTDKDGHYKTDALKCGQKFRLKVDAVDFLAIEMPIILGGEYNGVYTQNIGLDPVQQEIKKNDDLFKTLKLDTIYFDFDKSEIREDAAVELAKIVEVLNKYSTMKVEVRSHTDSRGDDLYNMKLSDRRVRSTIDWLLNNGVNNNQLRGQGYGGRQPLNGCVKGVPCTEEEYQLNRRSEFIVVEF